jgi:hypothetical protein
VLEFLIGLFGGNARPSTGAALYLKALVVLIVLALALAFHFKLI